MIRITLHGKQYVLRFDCGALEDMEEEFGGLTKAMQSMTDKNRRQSINKLFAILNRSGNAKLGLTNEVPDEILGRGDGMAAMKTIISAIQETFAEGTRMETMEKEDEVVDLTLAEIKARESKNALTAEG